MSAAAGGEHLDDARLARLMAGALDDAGLEALEEHVDRCAACSELLIGLARAAAPDGGDGGDGAEPGRTVGRYRIVRVLGRGGMGVVYVARDPVLQREVALKLVRPDLDEREAGTARLLGEARALAALAHPNVVAVHDAGELDGGVFVATELVAGQTVSAWVADAAPGLRAVLDVYRQAARGLIAAHAAGIVHRDVKPDNILIGDDGRVRVADFGLASDGRRHPRSRSLLATLVGSGGAAAAAALTRTGDLLGTPLYMAPEQLAGEVADARSDQFGFCVSLYESRYRQRPFAGRTIAELADNVRLGRVREVELAGDEASRLHAVILRGLAVRPEDRYPDLAALLAELDALASPAAPHRRKPSVLIVALAAIALAGAIAVVAAIAWPRGASRPATKASAPAPAQAPPAPATDPMVLHLEVARLVNAGDPACLAALARADAAGPPADYYDDRQVRARCLMMAGDCTAGTRAMRDLMLARGLVAVAADEETLRESRQHCSTSDPDDPWQERLARMEASVYSVLTARDIPADAHRRATELRALAETHRAELSDQQRYVADHTAGVVAEVLATHGNCPEAIAIRRFGRDLALGPGVVDPAADAKVTSAPLRACLTAAGVAP